MLRPGGACCVSFSDACWADKATAIWLEQDIAGRAALVERCMRANGFDAITVYTSPAPGKEGGSSMHDGSNTSGGGSSSSASAGASSASGRAGQELPAGDAFCAVVGITPRPQQQAAARGMADPAETASAYIDRPAWGGLQEAAAGSRCGVGWGCSVQCAMRAGCARRLTRRSCHAN